MPVRTSGAAGIPPRKRFGQHFLERSWARKVVEAIAPAGDQAILEIGPGRGAITGLLADRAGAVLAFEIDRDLAAALRAQDPRVRVVEGDFLDQTASTLQQHLASLDVPSGGLRVVGNLPYNAASPILVKLAGFHAAGVPIVDASVMLQREVADRVLAVPGTKEYGVLTIAIRPHADAERLLQLPPGAFRPPPRVQSTLIRLRFHPPTPAVRDRDAFATLVQAIFTRRRKTLGNALAAYPHLGARPPANVLRQAGIDPVRRPETLDVFELARLAEVLADPERAGAPPPP